MNVVLHPDASSLVDRALPWMSGDPVMNNIVATVALGAVVAPELFPDDCLWLTVEDGDAQVVGAAMRTPPRLLGLADMPPDAVTALAEWAADGGLDLPGVNGPAGATRLFADRWQHRTKGCVEPGMAMSVYRLDAVNAAASVSGTLRSATADDLGFLPGWVDGFARDVGESMSMQVDPEEVARRWLAQRGLQLWEDGVPVSMAGLASPVAGVVRVGLVYTPPEWRGRGYASACVAAVSQNALDAGASACMLFADVANPTSNGIYQRLGYRYVGDAQEYLFSGQRQSGR